MTTSKINFQPYLDWIDEQQSAMSALVQKWSDINTGTFNLPGLQAMAQELIDTFEPLGGQIKKLPSASMEQVDDHGELTQQPIGDMVRITMRPDAEHRVLLCGHMDTVFPSDSAFQKCRFLDDNRLHGPGVADMKGGLIVLLTALKALERSPWANNLGWEVLINADEEAGSHGSAIQLQQSAEKADIGLVYEPALPDGTLAGQRKGSGNFTVVVHGRAAHAGREHHLGRNAIAALAKAVSQIDDLNSARADVTVNVGEIQGGGALNAVPDLAICGLNVRVANEQDEAWTLHALESIISSVNELEGITATLHGGFTRKAKPITDEVAALFRLLQSCGEELNIAVNHKPTGGCCDGNNLAAAGLPNVDTLGVRGGKIHSDQEFLIIDSLAERAKLSALLLMKLAAGEATWPNLQKQNNHSEALV